MGAVLRSGSEQIEIAEKNRSMAASACFSGAGLYVVFIAISAGCVVGSKYIGREKAIKEAEDEQRLRDRLAAMDQA